MGMAAVLACCSRLTDDLFLVAAEELAGMAGEEELRAGRWVGGWVGWCAVEVVECAIITCILGPQSV
jgi:hypothetical protein